MRAVVPGPCVSWNYTENNSEMKDSKHGKPSQTITFKNKNIVFTVWRYGLVSQIHSKTFILFL